MEMCAPMHKDLPAPLREATSSPRAVWQALGSEPITEDYQKSGDKEALSPAPHPSIYACSLYQTLNLWNR